MLGYVQYDEYVKRFDFLGKSVPFIIIILFFYEKFANLGEIEPIKTRPTNRPPQNPLETYATVLVFALFSQDGQ